MNDSSNVQKFVGKDLIQNCISRFISEIPNFSAFSLCFSYFTLLCGNSGLQMISWIYQKVASLRTAITFYYSRVQQQAIRVAKKHRPHTRWKAGETLGRCGSGKQPSPALLKKHHPQNYTLRTDLGNQFKLPRKLRLSGSCINNSGGRNKMK